MQRDDRTGLPLIGAKRDKPVKVEILSDGIPQNTVVRDAESKAVIDGVTRIEMVLTPEGSELRLAFAPESYKLVMQGEAAKMDPPFNRVVDIQTDEPVALKEQSVLIVEGANGKRVVLVAQKVIDPDAPSAPQDAPEDSETQGIEGKPEDDERPPRATLGGSDS